MTSAVMLRVSSITGACDEGEVPRQIEVLEDLGGQLLVLGGRDRHGDAGGRQPFEYLRLPLNTVFCIQPWARYRAR